MYLRCPQRQRVIGLIYCETDVKVEFFGHVHRTHRLEAEGESLILDQSLQFAIRSFPSKILDIIITITRYFYP